MEGYLEAESDGKREESIRKYQEPEEYYGKILDKAEKKPYDMEKQSIEKAEKMPAYEMASPYYQAYPKYQRYLEEWEYEKDFEQMKRLYPESAKRLQGYIEEECDKMEYEGSRMFDAYPDKNILKDLCRKIEEKMDEDQMEDPMEKELELLELRCKHGRCPNRFFSDLIEVLLYNEMYQRRCRHKRCRRYW